MLSQEDYIVIKTLKARGGYNTDIAAELGVHPKTVSSHCSSTVFGVAP